MKKLLSLSLITCFCFTLLAQEGLNHEKKIYKNDEGKVYVNKALPLYLSISTSPDGSNGEVLDGKEPEYSSPMYLDSEGYNTIRTPWKVDPETKKVVYPKEEVIFELYADSKSPATKISYGDAKLAEGDEKTALTATDIKLTASDEISGIDAIYYSLDGASFQKYTGPIPVKEEKAYVLKYYAVDNVGNAEEMKSVTMLIDNSAPSSTLNVEGDLSENVVSIRSTINLEASDNASGVSKIFYTIDEGRTYEYTSPVSIASLSEGEHTITYFAVDKVDNNEEKKTYTFYLDKSPPRVIDEIIGNTFIANGKEYYSGRTKLKLVAMDNKAGVKEILYSINGGEFKLYEAPFYLTEAGNLNVEVLATDKVNNRVRSKEFSDKNNLLNYVDLSGPSLSYNVAGPSFTLKDTVYITKETAISLRGTDKDSGFKEIDYQVDDGTVETYSEPFKIESEGLHIVTYNGYDNLSNSSTESILCIVDNSGPVVYNRFSIDSNKSKMIDGESVDVYPPHVLLFLSSTDGHAGLDKISYQVNDGAMLPYRSLIENFRKDTLYEINVLVVDKLGNENQQKIRFYIE
ncbi:chitobiase/beta-hexosaminidase C-terminal domain-containing protein [Ekhidna sp. MALMAid0563]|uniref:chitobiase/beta-hexosaminidase C-terminal domain-containing protein n=1 Tax=Ekhidna sp. MALMAid0563 TaxID=3143937 RepID=UPI0032DE7D4C